jgi:hypothetical protein
MDRQTKRDKQIEKCAGRCSDEETQGQIDGPGNTKGGSITVPLTSCLTGLN